MSTAQSGFHLSARLFFKHWKRNHSNLSYRHNLGEERFRAITVGQQLEETAAKYGERECVISCHQNQRLTFGEILDQADQFAAGLRAIGLNKNDRVGLWAPNMVEWCVANLACARAGLILVAINPAYQPPEIEYSIKKAGIKAMICADKFKNQDYYQHLLTVAPELSKTDPGKLSSAKVPSLQHVIIMSQDSKKGAFNYGEIFDFGTAEKISSIRNNQNCVSPDDACNIQFTSGTTGLAKAAVTSHFQLVNNAYFTGKRNELGIKHHKICVQVPLFHAFGTVITALAALCHGATMVLPAEGYSPDKSLDAIKNEKCTTIHGTPTMYVDLVHRQEQRNENISPEIAISGGALCPPQLFKKMLQVLKVKKVKSVYGLTETSAVVFQSNPTDDEEKATGTVGYLSDHVEAKVVDKEGNMVPLGTPGELLVRCYANMLGYWGDEVKTTEMMGPDRWLKTGDQFVLREDGYGKVVGRIKEMIVRGGENIFPKEIEEFLITHPSILEIYVVGLPHERLGEEVCACVKFRPGSSLSYSDIKEFCKGNIAHFKIPSKVKAVHEFPKTTSGKVQKFKLVELLLADDSFNN